MIQFMLTTMTMIFSLIFMQMNHPLAMGLTLLIQTTLISLITGMFAPSFWFSYVLFLIFLGGMLVLFIYVTSLASNEMFSLSTKLLLMSTVMIMTFTVLMFMIDKQMITPFMENNEMAKIFSMNTFTPENTINLSKLYNYPTNFITLMLINYLLITLIAIVKITNIFEGPLRKTN